MLLYVSLYTHNDYNVHNYIFRVAITKAVYKVNCSDYLSKLSSGYTEIINNNPIS